MSRSPSQPTTADFQRQVEETLRKFLARFVRFFPVLESLENLQLFVTNVAECVARKVGKETPAERQRGRPDAALHRARRWLWRLCWGELINFPQDPILERTARLVTIVETAAAMPSFQGVGKYDSRLLVIEYELLQNLFVPLLKRRPAPFRRKFPAVTRGPLAGMKNQQERDRETRKKRAAWAEARRKAAEPKLDVRWWQDGKEFWFDETELATLTPQKAALTVMARNSNRSLEAVRDYIKEGNKMFSPEQRLAIDNAWKNRRHAPEVCQALGCCSRTA